MPRIICKANGIEIHYVRTGSGRCPLIALHGLMGSGACLSPLIRTLGDEFYVVVPDARGHGWSSAPSKGYLYPDLANDVVCLIDNIGLDAPILLGHSMGGMTAAVVASQLGSAVRGVVLVDPTFISPEWQAKVFESGVDEDHRQALKLKKSDLLAQARNRNPHRSAEMIEHLVNARLRTSMNAFEVLTPPNPDYRDLVRNIHAPTLLVFGERGVVSLDTARQLQSLNPLLRYELIPDGGHGLPYDEPERLGAVVKTFLHSLFCNSSASAASAL